LTVALARAGAEVLALETDRRLVEALHEVAGGAPGIRVVHADATEATWPVLLGDGPWRMASNLPYHVAVPVLLDLLEGAPEVDPLVITVQREVGERLAAAPGRPGYGAVSLKAGYRSTVRVVRRLPPSVFWPEPKVESVLLEVQRRPPPVTVPAPVLFELVDAGFAQRRKTMAGALVRMGRDRAEADRALGDAGLDPRIRAEAMGLEDFARLAEALGA
jgi:16S rRNA (adenine1518-N6/adenine1519-N6)-dimethyltransferase